MLHTVVRLRSTLPGVLAFGLAVAAVAEILPEGRASFGQLPLAFEPAGQNSFIARGPGYLMRIAPAESSFLLRGHESGTEAARRERLTPGRQLRAGRSMEALVRCRLEGASTEARIVGEGPLATKVNRLIGNDPAAWELGLPVFSHLRVKGIYPGIDAVYYGNQHQLEYDFEVAPGADSQQIRMVYDGVIASLLDGSGDLILETAAGPLRKKRPVAYQEIEGVRRAVPASYRLEDHSVDGSTTRRVEAAIHLGPYDRSRPLVIDPVLYYSTYLGGLGEDRAWDVAIAPDGLAVIVGDTSSRDFPVEGGMSTNYAGGSHDVFVAKIGPEGTNLIFSTYLGGSADEGPYGVAIGPDGDLYVTGATASTNFPVTADAVSPSIHGFGTLGSYEYDAFVTRLNPAGTTIKYSTYLGGSFDDNGLAIAVDGQGAAYVAGFTQSADFLPQASGGFLAGAYDAFVLKLTTTTNQLEGGFLLGGSLDDRAQGVAVRPDGTAVVVGFTASTNFPVTAATNPPVVAAWQPLFGGGAEDAWVAGLNATGGVAYCSFMGGSGLDEAFRVAFDTASRPVVVGVTGSTNFPVLNSLTATNAGASDWFIARLDSGGAGPFFSTYVGGSSSDEAWGVASGMDGSIFIVGNTLSTNFPLVKSFPRIYTATADAVVMKLNAAGNAVEYATTVGGVNEDQVTGVAVDANGHAYVAGFTKSLDFPMVPSTNAVDAVFGGITDAFVARISPGDATLSVSQPLAGQVQISWSTGLPGYKLFTTGAVPTSTNWTEVLLPVEVVGGENRVTLTNVTGEAFFQLRR